MICCIGLLIGLAIGAALGGPWILIMPAGGFVIGLIVDMKLIKHCCKGKSGTENQKIKPSRLARLTGRICMGKIGWKGAGMVSALVLAYAVMILIMHP